MRWRSRCNGHLFFWLGLLLALALKVQVAHAQVALQPLVNALLTSDEGALVLGTTLKADNLSAAPFLRLPFRRADDPGFVQLDRYASTWRSGLTASYERLQASPEGPITHTQISLQAEWGRETFTYFPRTVDAADSEKEATHSFALEIKGFRYATRGASFARQVAPQLRVRYGREWEEADEIGVVIERPGERFDTVEDVVRAAPSVRPELSLGFAFPYYRGRGLYAVNPALFYDVVGDAGESVRFGDVGRTRLETWLYYFPRSEQAVNVRVGVAPFLSVRTHGDDGFNRMEYGAILQVWVGSNLVEFF